jgi:arylsulfatase A-like enzyme
MLVKIMKALESIPEGSGTMMDNTLIVYTSNNAEKQHSDGEQWPFVLLGNAGGRFKTGQHTRIKNRPINDLYATFLHAAGAPVDRFNMDKNMANIHRSKIGPIEELLV